MKILLYKPDSKHGAFRMYSKSCDVEIVGDIVYVFENGQIKEAFKLVEKQELTWTDNRKPITEIMVKLVVTDIIEREQEELILA